MAGSTIQTIRKQSTDGLDCLPTQPWPTRAFMDLVKPKGLTWEPACGGGHMAEVLRESDDLTVIATDIHDHGYPMLERVDFLEAAPRFRFDWVITNPPYHKKLSQRFVLRALEFCPNVAVLCRLSWLEGSDRHEQLFGRHPPSRVMVFSERIGFRDGECDVGRGGMIQYAWYVWEEGTTGTQLTWIPPGSKDRYTRDDDHVQFNGPVVKRFASSDSDGHALGVRKRLPGPLGASHILFQE